MVSSMTLLSHQKRSRVGRMLRMVGNSIVRESELPKGRFLLVSEEATSCRLASERPPPCGDWTLGLRARGGGGNETN